MKKIFTIILSIFMIIGCVSCNKGNNDDSTLHSMSKRMVLNCSWNDEPTSMNVMRYSGVIDLKVIWNLYEPLVRIENGQVVAAGAKSWSVSDDGLVYTFSLRDNYWSDGQKVSAFDYLTMLQRAADPVSEFSYASDYYGIKNFEDINSHAGNIETLGVHAESENTLVIELEYPNNTFLSSIEIYPERKDIIDKFSDRYGYSPETMLYCGPYKMTEWVHNSTIKLEKNEYYWDAKNVRIDEVNLHIIPDEFSRLMSFQTGEIDYVSVSDPNYISEFRNNSNMYEERAESARTYMFIFNCKDKLLQNIKIRQALSLSIDREEITTVLDNGMTKSAYGLIPPKTSVGKYDFRMEVDEPLLSLAKKYPEAKSLLIDGLKELGLSDNTKNVTITLSTPSGGSSQEMAEYYKAMWEKNLGINVKIDMQEFASFRSLIWSDGYQVATTAWGGSIEPQFQLSRWLPKNQSQWDNNEYANLVNEGIRSSDEAIRLKYYSDAEKMLISDYAVIAPIKYDGYFIFYYNYIKQSDSNPFSNVGFKSMSIER